MIDKLSMYFLYGNANKIYLDALWRRHSALLPPIAENPCECKIPAEYTCPETFRKLCISQTVKAPYTLWNLWVLAHLDHRDFGVSLQDFVFSPCVFYGCLRRTSLGRKPFV